MIVTQRDIAETITGLRQTAHDLRDAADSQKLPGTEEVVAASVSGLRSHAEFLERVSRELLHLIDDETPVEVPDE